MSVQLDSTQAIASLVGRTVVGLWVNEDQQFLMFDTTRGPVIWSAEADCCAESWFADITGVSALLGHTVRVAEGVDMPGGVVDARTRQDVDRLYGVKLITDRGYVDVIFRCSSSGWYGGDLYLHDSMPDYAGKFRQITEDWSA